MTPLGTKMSTKKNTYRKDGYLSSREYLAGPFLSIKGMFKHLCHCDPNLMSRPTLKFLGLIDETV
jgi:hypothetical protein